MPKKEMWRQPGVDYIPDNYWYAEDVVVKEDPCAKVLCKKCGAKPGSQTLTMSQNWIDCENGHLIGTNGVTKEYAKKNYKIIGIVNIGGVYT